MNSDNTMTGLLAIMTLSLIGLYAYACATPEEPTLTKCKVTITPTGYYSTCDGKPVDITVEKEGEDK